MENKNVMEETKEETTEEQKTTVNEPPPLTEEDIEQLKDMSFEERKLWLNQRAFAWCETTKSVGKYVITVLCYPNTLLHAKAKKVTDFGQKTQNIIDIMINTMYSYKGMGLSATQLGYLENIFIIDCAASNPKSASDLRIFINPEITEKSKETIKEAEGCLSFPGILEPVTRFKGVKGKAFDREGKEFEFDFHGDIHAVAVQHEFDHLLGITMLDHLKGLNKKFALKKLKRGIKYKDSQPKHYQRRNW